MITGNFWLNFDGFGSFSDGISILLAKFGNCHSDNLFIGRPKGAVNLGPDLRSCRLPKLRGRIALRQTEEWDAALALLVQIDRKANGEPRPWTAGRFYHRFPSFINYQFGSDRSERSDKLARLFHIWPFVGFVGFMEANWRYFGMIFGQFWIIFNDNWGFLIEFERFWITFGWSETITDDFQSFLVEFGSFRIIFRDIRGLLIEIGSFRIDLWSFSLIIGDFWLNFDGFTSFVDDISRLLVEFGSYRTIRDHLLDDFESFFEIFGDYWWKLAHFEWEFMEESGIEPE